MRYILIVVVNLLLFCVRGERDNPFDAHGNNWNPPTVTLRFDATVNIKDSLPIAALTPDNKKIVKYLWTINGKEYVYTSEAPLQKVTFSDSGNVVISVKVFDENGVVSEPASGVLRVTLDPPTVTINADSTVNLKDSLKFSAKGTDNGRILAYLWAKNGVSFSDTTPSDFFATSWTDSGIYVVKVKVMDDDSLCSEPATHIVNVWYGAPRVEISVNDTTYIKDTVWMTAAAKDSGRILTYCWSTDGTNFTDTTPTGSFKKVWKENGRYSVKVKVLDDDSLWSEPSVHSVVVLKGVPVVDVVSVDSTFINTKVECTAKPTDNGVIRKFVWSENGGAFTDTTPANVRMFTWPQSGRYCVRVKVIDDDSLESKVDSCIIFVSKGIPVVTVKPDFRVNIYDSLPITATASDNGKVTKFVWATHGSFSDTTPNDTRNIAFPDSGRKCVLVKAVDNDGNWSEVDSAIIHVALDAPVITRVHDTVVNFSTSPSLSILFPAIDTNKGGKIRMYYWGTGATGWEDSSAAPLNIISPPGGGSVTVRWAAGDDDRIMSFDTFTVIFNRPPVIAQTASEMLSSATAYVPYEDSISVTDADGDLLNFSILNPLFGMNFLNGVFSWTPIQNDTGSKSLTFIATDSRNAADTLTWNVVVRRRHAMISDPSAPTGPYNGAPGTYYRFSTMPVTCSHGDAIQYRFLCGNNQFGTWRNEPTDSIVWTNYGFDTIKVEARCSVDTTKKSVMSTGRQIAILNTPDGTLFDDGSGGLFSADSRFGTSWYTYDDFVGTCAGRSVMLNNGGVVIHSDSTHSDFLFTANEGNPSGSSGACLKVNFKLDSVSGCIDSLGNQLNFTGLGATLNRNGSPRDLSGLTKIIFWAKALRPMDVGFNVVTSDITDNSNYRHRVSVSTDWQKIEIAVDSLVQPSWASPKIPLRINRITKMHFEFDSIYPNPRENSVWIDDFCLQGYLWNP